MKTFFEHCFQEVHDVAARALRSERANHTLRPTEIVSLAYARMCRQRNLEGADRQKLVGAAVITIRRILIDHARKRSHGPPENLRIPLDSAVLLEVPGTIDWLTMDEALDDLEKKDPLARRVAELRLFLKCTHNEVAQLLGISHDAAGDSWLFGQAWLNRRLGER